MAQQPQLDEEYETGVYYDTHGGEYCEISDLGHTIGLFVPGREEPYYTYEEDGLSKGEAIQSVEDEMHEVSQSAIENPKRVVKAALRREIRNDINELASVPEQETIDLLYARDRVVIQEIDD